VVDLWLVLKQPWSFHSSFCRGDYYHVKGTGGLIRDLIL
jgi:hypothetical protein